jgi:hypothetical protein
MPVRVTRDDEIGSGQDGNLYSLRTSDSKKIDSDEYNRTWAKFQPKGPKDQRVDALISQMKKLQTMCEVLGNRVNALERNMGRSTASASSSSSRSRGRGKQASSSAWKALNE